MHKVRSAKTVFGAMAVALVGAIVIVATPVAAAVSEQSGFGAQGYEKSAAIVTIEARKKKKKKKRTRFPYGRGS